MLLRASGWTQFRLLYIFSVSGRHVRSSTCLGTRKTSLLQKSLMITPATSQPQAACLPPPSLLAFPVWDQFESRSESSKLSHQQSLVYFPWPLALSSFIHVNCVLLFPVFLASFLSFTLLPRGSFWKTRNHKSGYILINVYLIKLAFKLFLISSLSELCLPWKPPILLSSPVLCSHR